ncbi:protein CANDIDATE G-PROTEIN COUPLED RECEPTOR 7-like [Syzygium oleosum]|uniref:protein CANDIDATE G-PROTEIN COUPLED RECEPTOR 7-like n=1 Tax=Syzygium oleosum TaxID=219896 RepID=UPI0024BB68D7|nr:protein CANDIDATE G-PROTEIN COUPLED RECEPTOR 7-like [Syzygium oleosum]
MPSLISHSDADIKTQRLTSDPCPIILLDKFTFTHFSRVTISVSDVSFTSSLLCPNPSCLDFFLLSEEVGIQAVLQARQNPNFCILDSCHILVLDTFHDLSPPPHSFFNRAYRVTCPSGYSLFFANCDLVARVSMKVHTELYNLDLGGSKTYLSPGQSKLIPLFFEFSLAYFFVLVLWDYYCFCHKEFTNRVHHLIIGLIATKTLSLICAGLDKYSVKLTGTPHGWEILIRSCSSDVIIYHHVNDHNRILVLQEVLAREGGQVTWPNVSLVLALLDMICTCTILVTAGRSIWLLKEVPKTDEKAAIRLAKIKKFALFYVLAIGYFYVVPMVALALRIFRYEWVSNAVEDGANLTIYVVTLCMFRPVNDYTILRA